MSSHDISRRHAIKTAGALGAIAALPTFAAPNVHQQPATQAAAKLVDRDFVIAAGMTEAEADCWETIARVAAQFFNLPEMHPMDKQEVANAVHVVQNKLLSRPTYRKYLENAKAANVGRTNQQR